MQQWMIHEIDDYDIDIIKRYISKEDILFFDDAVLSQKRIVRLIDYQCILCVSTDIADKVNCMQDDMYPYRTSYLHNQWHMTGSTYGFMSWQTITNMKVQYALHGTSHTRASSMSYKEFMHDVIRGCERLQLMTNSKPLYYVYPYNDSNDITDSIVRKAGMKPIGKGRIDYAKWKLSIV